MVLPRALSFARSLHSHRLLPAAVCGAAPAMSVAATSPQNPLLVLQAGYALRS